VSRAAEIFGLYARLAGDAPYPSFTLAFTERDLPGGHSPAYFAAVDQPRQFSLTWRNDPVNFDSYPSFFIAHEIAHQWWGQAVGWKNYHEQWLSEGFAQYFALLYAEEHLGSGVLSDVLKQMRRSAIRESEQGPIYLGYRLGHIKADPRVFRSLVYNKAAMVLHMLRGVIGDEAFFSGIREFFATWKYRKAGTGDLIDVMERASGRDLSEYFEMWVFGAGLPEAKFSYRIQGSRAILRIEQSGPPMEFPVRVRLSYRDRDDENVIVVAREKVTEHAVELKGALRSASVKDDHGTLAEIR
jgi:aminopeptidase N